MALRVLEYNDIGTTTRGSIPIPMEPALLMQQLDVTATSVQSAPFNSETCIIRLQSDEDCLIAFGSNPDASEGSDKLKAGADRIVAVRPGTKVAVTAANVKSISKMGNMDSLEALVKLLASPADAQKQFAIMHNEVASMTAAADDLRKTTQDNRAASAELVQATTDAKSAKALADQAAGDVAAREAALAADKQSHASKVASDLATLDDRATALAGREAGLDAKQSDLAKQASGLSDLKGVLDAREKDLTAREDAAAAIQADYQARVAKLKALTA